MPNALINPKMLVWARKKARLSVEEVAQKVGRSAENVVSWEDGSLRPTLAQARRVAQIIKQPLALLYLSEPPRGFQLLQDFRTINSGLLAEYSVELESLISKTRNHQDWTKDFLLSEDVESMDFVGSASIKDDPCKLAASIRKTLQISVEGQIKSRSVGGALRYWIDHAEEAQIFVVREGSVSSSEARGFVLADPVAPFVFLNSNDSDGGKLFSLVHELAHLWLGESGLLDCESVFSPKSSKQRVEKFCNTVASFLLLEPAAFDATASEFQRKTDDAFDFVRMLASRFKVSQEVVARRLLDQGVIKQEVYGVVREEGIKGWLKTKEQRRKRSGGDHYLTILARNGHAFTTLVLEAFSGGFINCRDASGLLSTKINHLSKLASYAGADFSLGGM